MSRPRLRCPAGLRAGPPEVDPTSRSGDGGPLDGGSQDVLRADLLRDGDRRRRVPWRQRPRCGQPRRGRDGGVPDRGRAVVPGVRGLRTWRSLHGGTLLRQPGRVSVLGRRRLRDTSPLHARSVLRQPGGQPVLGPEPVWQPRPLHRRHVLRQRERIAMQRVVRMRTGLGLCEREVQLSVRLAATRRKPPGRIGSGPRASDARVSWLCWSGASRRSPPADRA